MPGQFLGSDSLKPNRPAASPVCGFVPNHTRGHAAIESGAFGCVTCGHAWTSLDPGKLRNAIVQSGDELARQRLDELERGPLRDLPDTEVAREIASKVARIDALVYSGRTGAVALYRELAGVIWDEAISQMRRWSRLSRPEKLALFGWVEKVKCPPDDLL